jgi:hypothetical protein
MISGTLNTSYSPSGPFPEVFFMANTLTCLAWNENWPEIATSLCGVDDGLPARVDGFELTKAKHREARIKALGNAIVPQIAIEIMQAIKLVEARL